jgi:hypothetical protein
LAVLLPFPHMSTRVGPMWDRHVNRDLIYKLLFPSPQAAGLVPLNSSMQLPQAFITAIDLLAAAMFFYILITLRDRRRRRGLPYPPGPPSLPIIGNLLDVPNETPWTKYADISKKYGAVNNPCDIHPLITAMIRRCILSSNFRSGRRGAELTLCGQGSTREAWRNLCRSAYASDPGNVHLTVVYYPPHRPLLT